MDLKSTIASLQLRVAIRLLRKERLFTMKMDEHYYRYIHFQQFFNRELGLKLGLYP